MSTDLIVPALLTMSVAAVHTTTMVFTQLTFLKRHSSPLPIAQAFTDALLHLASDNRQYLEPIRVDAAEAVRAHGWTKKGLDSMQLIDSYLKECLRINSIAMGRHSVIH